MNIVDDRLEVSCSNCARSMMNRGNAVHLDLRPGDSVSEMGICGGR